MADTKQKSFRLPPEEWEALVRIVRAGRADDQTSALRWLLGQADELLAEPEPGARAELLAAKDAHIASLESALAQTQRLADQAQQLAAMSQQRLAAPEPAKGKKRKRK